MCYLIKYQQQDTGFTVENWVCCYCKKYANKFTDTTCKKCGHDRCATFGEDDYETARKTQANMPKGHTGEHNCPMCKGMPRRTHCLYLKNKYATLGQFNTTTQYEQAKTGFNLLLQTPIQNQEFLIYILTLQGMLNISQNGPPQGDRSISKPMWNRLSSFLETCRSITDQRYYIDELFRLTPNPITLLCPLCDEPQFQTPSGPTCKNGHGGVDGIPQK